MQILTLGLILTVSMSIKLTFMMDYADLVILIFAQLLRFVIWSLTLLNFMKSVTSLIVNPAIKVMIRCLQIYMYAGAAFYVCYGIVLVILSEK